MQGPTQTVMAALILASMAVSPVFSAGTGPDPGTPGSAANAAASARLVKTIPTDQRTAEDDGAAGWQRGTVSDSASREMTLDLSGLEQRLRETNAIGLFTKIALKDQINDLLDDFRAYHNRRSGARLDQLHERYNLLLLKVQSLLQNDAPQLAHEVYRSRKAIWDVLADPQKFAEQQT